MARIIKRYSELIKIPDFKDRYEYLKLGGRVSEETFGGHRKLNQILYKSYRWKEIKRKVIIRDEACDLAHKDFEIYGIVYIHHINPITIEDIINEHPSVYDMENLVCTTFDTHNGIHYGDQQTISKYFVVNRTKNDTCPWRK